MKLKNDKTELPTEIKSIIEGIFANKEKNQYSSNFVQELLNYVECYRSEINQHLCYKRMYKK